MDKVGIYQSILEKDKNNVEVWFLLGEEYLKQDQLSEALYSFSRALKTEQTSLDNSIREILIKYLSHGNGEVYSEILEEPIHTSDIVKTNEQFLSSLPDTSQNLPVKLEVVKGGKDSNVVSMNEHLPERITFDDVGGLDSLKKTIEMKIIKPFLNPGIFTKFRKKSGGGILLYGPPGCGKTFIAKATAGECSANFYPVSISEILDPYLGVSEQNLHNVFATARANSPAVLFFDELDSFGYSRGKARSDIMRPLVDTMLTELQGIETSTNKLLVIGATNMPWDVDSAFKRPGRFDKLVFVPPPDEKAREIVFKLKLRSKPIGDDVDLGILAKQTNLYSGADIENVVEIATETVLEEIMESGLERNISMNDLLQAIHSTRPSTVDWLTTIKNYIKYSNQSGVYDEAAKYIKEHF
ncbi:AAA family ATPase [Bacillus sp. ISL-45]|uniref:AAA family ATPase n=1 Tax=Bacillus sp. ISL-45 TaxID=2819128 RepID=UPI001BE948F6|nr:AAA family ATPase [Bacillus sp. ISL-45]MBT2659758.1 AAA family ATPase [Bacillus sp. ISL-45]